MMITGAISTVEGELYRLAVGGTNTMPIPKMQHVCRWEINFDTKQVVKTSPTVGDQVLAYFEGESFLHGVIIGLL